MNVESTMLVLISDDTFVYRVISSFYSFISMKEPVLIPILAEYIWSFPRAFSISKRLEWFVSTLFFLDFDASLTKA